MSTTVLAPVAGRALVLAQVPDPVFSAGMVGPGLAVDPERGAAEAVAPIDGQIVKLHAHAFIVAGAGGRGVLVHLGIDTVQLKGTGFRLLAREGDLVSAGRPIVAWNPADIEAAGRSPVCPVIALDAAAEAVAALALGPVRAGDELFRWE
ncbi:PTS glucose transporter subunit IIA [Microtetraspora sp. NBRC 13810]|uniref:PTS sugar transporter subunit IIA n=1 Tax=Microtetraspora sp. NBRC 13810 TaxID=3030990 RepID=UPI002556C108|nr:PTS glucose transporter subunit IIA [Microtetraspora sp. NBRC 13810]